MPDGQAALPYRPTIVWLFVMRIYFRATAEFLST